MSDINNVSGTAFIVAEFRADENKEINPLYTDEIVRLLLNNETKQLAEYVTQNFPLAKEMIKLRTKYFDDVLSNQISLDYKQVVILGSGLDTRSVRKNVEGVNYFEIEHKNTLQLKEEILNRNKIISNVHYIPGDYVKDDLVNLLKNNNFDFELPTYFLWEGNTTLITKNDVTFVLKKLCDNIQHFKISFDYMSEKVISRTTGYQDINDYIDKYESMYTPWITGFDNIEVIAKNLGLKVIDNWSTADLFKKYRPNRSLESNILNFYFVCTLENL